MATKENCEDCVFAKFNTPESYSGSCTNKDSESYKCLIVKKTEACEDFVKKTKENKKSK